MDTRVAFLCFLAVAYVAGDCYMHNPRGSNNRANEKSANRKNGDRLFDSQNNNRGGYNIGDQTDKAFNPNSRSNEPGSYFNKELNEDQYSLIYYSGSELPIEWTAQHGCGGNEDTDPHKLNCNMVLQYTCNTNSLQTDKALMVELKNGRNTNTPDDANNFGDIDNQKDQNDDNRRGRHESEAWYYECENRARNKGLFTADQNLKGNTQKYTRQNNNGNRRGLECPEERDYYPYWNPSPWIDIAVLTDTTEDCVQGEGSYKYQSESMNVKPVGKCIYTGNNNDERKKVFNVLTESDCLALKSEDNIGGAEWKEFSHEVPAPKCEQGEWSRVNHLGNGKNGQPLMYHWTIPPMNQLGKYTDTKNGEIAKCVLRIRYNISTDDYDPRTTDARSNERKNQAMVSPITQNPTVDVGANLQGLRLAINTNQFGRTFQDRSHTFYIKKKPAGTTTGRILNLNVRGKRGNIVQTFPSVEYDFIPNNREVKVGDMIHVQWTGSNTHNNGNPAGDGQAGDAGEGTGGTDRHNIVCTSERDKNFPVAVDKDVHAKECMFKNDNFKCYKHKFSGGYMRAENALEELDAMDCALYLASSGYYKGVADVKADNDLNVLLNNAPASLEAGIFLKPMKAGEYNYMCTRNNNFSNRSQKGTLKVVP